MMKRNISDVIKQFNDELNDLTHRYYSFDFCYSHFRHSKESGKIEIEKSCQVLWGYLASWGMLRGSSFLLGKNPAYLKKLVELIYAQPASTWEIDLEDYPSKTDEIIHLYQSIKECLIPEQNNNRHITLITKILLGVFAIVPAYDRFFAKTFSDISKESGKPCSFGAFNRTSLEIIHQFYLANKSEIDKLSRSKKVIDFNGNETAYYYSKAKLIDMYGFQFEFEK